MLWFNLVQVLMIISLQVHYNIGKLNSDLGNIENAIRKYRLAIRYI